MNMKMFLSLNCSGSHRRSCIGFLNLLEEAQRCESLEYFPLELRRLAIDAIQIFQMTIRQIPFKFCPSKLQSVHLSAFVI